MATTRKPGARAVVKVLTAAAARVKLNIKGKIDGKPVREKWQGDAWDVFDMIPEVGQAVTFMANVVSGVRLFVALRPDNTEEEPGPVPAGTPGATEAEAVLDRLRTGSARGGIGGLLSASVMNLKVPGEYWLLGEEELAADPTAQPPRPFRPERWEIKSVDEIEIKDRGEVIVKDRPGRDGRHARVAGPDNIDDPDAVFLLRVWDPHPRYSGLARSSLRAALGECDELLLLGRCIRAAARRFLAGNGLLAVPSELDLPGGPDEGDDADPETSQLMSRLAKAMVESMADEGNPDSLVPLLLMGPGELLQKIQHVAFGKDFDAEARELRRSVLERLGASLDIPIEQLTGIAKVNHWGAWQIDGASWARYGQPTTRLIVESWTEGLLWPFLEEAGVAPEDARKLLIWFDPADAVMDPDESKTADELFDRGAISWDSYRARKGAGEDEAPDDAELDRRSQLGLLRGAPARNDPNAPGPPNDGETPAAPASTTNGNGHRPLTAAAGHRDPLGRRLMRIDRSLRARLEEAAEAAMRRALGQAGATVRRRARGNDNVSAAIDGVPNVNVCARVGPALVAAMDMTEDDLLAGGIDDMAQRFDTRVAQAQRQTRRDLATEFDLDDEELTALEQRQDRDRNEAWLWLSAALLALGRDRLYNPAPAAPAVGEFDVSSTVPTSIIREAMARAGGGLPSEGQPAGGVATGQLVMDVWAENGKVVGGWEWVYGDSSSRTQPFPSHEDLDGEQFAHWSDEILLVQGGDEWLGVTHYRPGDHPGCQCDFVPLDVDEAAPTSEERDQALMEAIA